MAFGQAFLFHYVCQMACDGRSRVYYGYLPVRYKFGCDFSDSAGKERVVCTSENNRVRSAAEQGLKAFAYRRLCFLSVDVTAFYKFYESLSDMFFDTYAFRKLFTCVYVFVRSKGSCCGKYAYDSGSCVLDSRFYGRFHSDELYRKFLPQC